MIRRHYLVTGRVQGVGFRRFTQREAGAQNLRGAARNLRDGRVEIIAVGPASGLEIFEAAISRGPTGSSVSQIEKRDVAESPIEEAADFAVLKDGEAPWL